MTMKPHADDAPIIPHYVMNPERLEAAIGPALTDKIISLSFYNNMLPVDFEAINQLAAGATLLGAEPITNAGTSAGIIGAFLYFKSPGGDVAALEMAYNIFTGLMDFNGAIIK